MRLSFIYMLIVLITGCDNRSLPGADDGGFMVKDSADSPKKDSSSPKKDSPGKVPLLADAGLLTPSECVIAVRLDICCLGLVPALRSAVEKDPCLRIWPAMDFAPECYPEVCPAVLCDTISPPTRLVGLGPDGAHCQWISECKTASDCVEAFDARQCCMCAQVYPWAIVNKDPCLAPVFMSAWPPPGCNEVCERGGDRTSNDCIECPVGSPKRCEPVAPAGVPGLNRCQPSW